MYYLGIDHHKRYSQVAVVDEKGTVRTNGKIANEKKAFALLKEYYKEPCRAVIEAIKSDSIDAKILAHLLRADLVPQVHVPSKEVREQKNLLRHRLWLVRLQTMTKNRIHQLIDRNHVQRPKVKNLFGIAGRTFLKGLSLSLIDQKLLKDHLELLDTLHEHIRKTEVWIGKELKDNPYISILGSLPGFGKILSALAALEIDNINRFRTPAKFASYSALIPSTLASGGKVYHGDLIPGGNRWLKYVFIEASWVSIRTSGYCRFYFIENERP